MALATTSVVGLTGVADASPGATWTSPAALPTVSATTGAESVPDPLGGSLLFYVLNGTPTIASVTSGGTVG